MTNNTQVNKPAPIAIGEQTIPFYQGSDSLLAIEALEQGEFVLITTLFSDGILLLKELHHHLKERLANKTYQEQRNYRSEFQRLSNQILIEVVNQQLAVKKAPTIGWLDRLYSDNNHFLLPFPQVQGLNSAWQWYIKGISMPVLRNKVHPYYGIYFSTRFEHLILFDNWLKRYEGPKKAAFDIGFGCGVLSLLMVQHGFQKVFATDINPNAVVGLAESMGTTKLSRKIELDLGHLFGKWEKPHELIVFNPPWLPVDHASDGVDEAMNYTENLFPDFFAAAKERLLPEGKLVLIFSNLAQITHVTKEHPIEKEIADNDRFQVERCFKKAVKRASDKTKRDQHWRAEEAVELWVLTHK